MRVAKWLGGALGLLVVGGAVVLGAASLTGVAQAQQPEEDASRFQELLAEKLGVDVETLVEAQKAARDELIDEAVADGKLTQEQAERLKELPVGGFFGGRHFLGRAPGAAVRIIHNVIDAAAEVIGIDASDVRAGLRDGTSIADQAADQGIGRDQLIADLKTELQGRINEAEANGTITADQADRLTEALDEHIEQAIDRAGGEGFPGRMGGFRFHRFGPR